jgi:hypothetical protein
LFIKTVKSGSISHGPTHISGIVLVALGGLWNCARGSGRAVFFKRSFAQGNWYEREYKTIEVVHVCLGDSTYKSRDVGVYEILSTVQVYNKASFVMSSENKSQAPISPEGFESMLVDDIQTNIYEKFLNKEDAETRQNFVDFHNGLNGEDKFPQLNLAHKKFLDGLERNSPSKNPSVKRPSSGQPVRPQSRRRTGGQGGQGAPGTARSLF